MTKMITLWDKNGLTCERAEADVAAFVEAFAHRDFSTTPRPIVLGCTKAQARARFVGNRVLSMRRRWARKHERAVADAMLAGKAQADAVAIANEKWGAMAPTPDAIALELADQIPASMREEA